MLLRRINTLRDREDGVALMAVVGIAAACMLILALVASSAIQGLGVTSASRASVQSQSSAEAGIAAAMVGMNVTTGSSTCAAVGGVYKSATGTVPIYEAKVYKPNGAGGWTLGCPADVGTPVRIVSKGTAADAGQVGHTANDETSVETILGPGATPTSTGGAGPAVYSFSSSGFGASGTLVSINGSTPNVMIAQGDVACSGASTGAKDLVVDNGSITMSGSCNLSGSVWVSNTATVSGGVTVGGNVIANGVTVNSATVGGGVWSTSYINMDGNGVVNGNTTSQTLSFPGSGTVKGSSWVYGTTTLRSDTKINGTLTTKTLVNPTKGTIGSKVIIPAGPGTSPYATPIKPTVPNWIDFGYVPADWVSLGFATATLSGTSCKGPQVQAALAGFTGSVVLNASGCTNGIVIDGADVVSFPKDLAIFAPSISVIASGGLKTTSTSGRVWLITPDAVADGVPTTTAPTCPQVKDHGVWVAAQSIILSGNPQLKVSNLAIMVYTPCPTSIGTGVNMNGQIFVGAASIDGNAHIGFVPVGLPGYNMETGGTVTGGTTLTLNRAVISTRNIQAGG